jgi:hypothetical protein
LVICRAHHDETFGKHNFSLHFYYMWSAKKCQEEEVVLQLFLFQLMINLFNIFIPLFLFFHICKSCSRCLCIFVYVSAYLGRAKVSIGEMRFCEEFDGNLKILKGIWNALIV